MNIDFESIKKNYSIVNIALRLGIEIDKNNKCICMFHNDNNPSMQLYTDSNRFYCFSCNAKGTIIDLVMKVNNYDAKKACEYITGNSYSNKQYISTSKATYSQNNGTFKVNRINNSHKPKSIAITQSDSNNKEHTELNSYHDVYTSLLQNEYTQYDTYLKSKRSITIQYLEYVECRIVKDSLSLENKLINKYGLKKLQDAGLYSKNNNFLFQNDYLLIPYFDKNNKIHTIKARSIKEKRFANCSNRSLILYGINRLYNDFTLIIDNKLTIINHKNIDTIYITESEIDTLSFLQVGKIAVACSGSSWNDNYTKELLHVPNIIIATDNDNAGEKLKYKIIESFNKYRKEVSYVDIKAYKNNKDINEVLNHMGDIKYE